MTQQKASMPNTIFYCGFVGVPACLLIGEKEGVCCLFGHKKARTRYRRGLKSIAFVRLTVFVKGRFQVFCNQLGRTAFDVVALDEVHEFAVFHQRDAG